MNYKIKTGFLVLVLVILWSLILLKLFKKDETVKINTSDKPHIEYVEAEPTVEAIAAPTIEPEEEMDIEDEVVYLDSLQGYVTVNKSGSYSLLSWDLVNSNETNYDFAQYSNKFIEIKGNFNEESHTFSVKELQILKDENILIPSVGELLKIKDNVYSISGKTFESSEDLSSYVNEEVVVYANQSVENNKEHLDFKQIYKVFNIEGVLAEDKNSTDNHKHYIVNDYLVHSDFDLDSYIGTDVSFVVFKNNESTNSVTVIKSSDNKERSQ